MATHFTDIAEYFKSGLTFQDLYKLNNFGTTLLPQNTTQRAQALTKHRRETRGDALLKRRNISMSKMSPYVTPHKKNAPAAEKAIEDRRAKLARWQQMKKAKLQAEREKKKPPFKVGVAAPPPPPPAAVDTTRFVGNFSRIGAGEVVSNAIRETRTVRLRNAKKEVEEVVRGNKRATTLKSASSESSLASERSQGYTCRTRSQSKALEARNNTKEVKVAKKPTQEKKDSKQQRTPKKSVSKTKTTTKPPSSSEEEQKIIVPEAPAKKNPSRTRKTAIKTAPSSEKDQSTVVTAKKASNKSKISVVNKSTSLNEKKLEVVVPEVTAKKSVKTSVKVPSSSEESLETVATKTPTKKKTNHKTPTKSSSHEENLASVKTSAKKHHNKTKPTSVTDKTTNERPVLSEITPEKNIPAIYISPFVTVSRGKNSARKEYHKRRSLNDSQEVQLEKNDVDVYTSPTAGAAYFRNILKGTISRLQGMCEEWETYKGKDSPPEEACDMINVAIGQSQLLINKKFQQFRGLIDRCEAKIPEAPVTCEDLHGFWDVIHMQVVNIDKRFDNLKTLKENNWVEIIPEKKVVVAKKVQAVKKKTVKATSNLKDIIKAARQLQKTQENNRFDGGFFSVSSPAKNTEETAKNTPRKSTRSRSSLYVNSPGLQVLRASANIKQIAEGKTPTRSILKSGACLTSERKTVLFQDDVENNTEFDKTPRKSQRLSRCASKLKF